MDTVGTITNAVLLVLVGGLLSWQLNGRLRALEARIEALDGRINTLQHAVDGVRSDLTQVALAVDVESRVRREPRPRRTRRGGSQL